MANIPNPPNAPAGYVPKWNGSDWEVVPLVVTVPTAQPEGLPEGYRTVWNGSEWDVVAPPEPPAPPAPSPDTITAHAISTSVYDLQTIAYLTTSEMGQHITPESRQEVTDYIHAVANILATAQTKYGTGEAYEPTFPPMPTAMPQLGSGDDLPAPYIRFVAGE